MSLRKCVQLVITVALLFPPLAGAQDAPHITIMNLQSPERNLGAKAADALRERIAHDFSEKQLGVVATDVVQRALQQSGFSPAEPLDPANESLLAHVVEAQYYITGTVTHSTTGYQLSPQLVLTRSTSLSQPLPPSVGKDLNAAVRPVSQALRAALKQVNAEQQCRNAIRDGKAQVALTAAQAGIAAYPQGILARYCALDVYWGTLYPHATTHADSLRYADSALTVARTIVVLDSTNATALRAEAELYSVTGNPAAARQALLNIARAQPNDLILANQVINSLMAVHDSSDALKLVGELLNKNPDDLHTLQTAFTVYVHTQQWPSVITTGPRLIRLDTAAADSMYFLRMAVAYESQKQPQQAAATLQQGTAKFPHSASLWQLYAQDLRQAGQTAEANVALKRAVALNPKMSVALLQLAEAYAADHRPDSAYATLQQAAAAPDGDKALIAQTAFAQGARLYQDAKGPTSRADYQQAVRVLQLSNQLSPSVDAQFLAAASSFAIMQSATQEANDTKSCSLARLASQTADDIPAGLAAGAKDPKYQASATQMTQTLPQFRTAIARELKRFCH